MKTPVRIEKDFQNLVTKSALMEILQDLAEPNLISNSTHFSFILTSLVKKNV